MGKTPDFRGPERGIVSCPSHRRGHRRAQSPLGLPAHCTVLKSGAATARHRPTHIPGSAGLKDSSGQPRSTVKHRRELCVTTGLSLYVLMCLGFSVKVPGRIPPHSIVPLKPLATFLTACHDYLLNMAQHTDLLQRLGWCKEALFAQVKLIPAPKHKLNKNNTALAEGGSGDPVWPSVTAATPGTLVSCRTQFENH